MFVAILLIVTGALIFVGAMATLGFDFSRLSTEKYETNTYEVSEEFDKISVDVNTTDIEFVLTDSETCKVICNEQEKVKHSVKVEEGMLVINVVDTRDWKEHIGISIGTMKMTIYLPREQYTSLFVGTDTGDIKLAGFSTEEIELTTTTGDMNINDITVEETVCIKTDTGRVSLTHVVCNNFSAESDTGTIILKDVTADTSFRIETDTGDVKLDGCDAAQIYIKTDTGDVTGSLLSEKVFIVETSTGDINVPKNTTGDKCEIITSTGDVKIIIR